MDFLSVALIGFLASFGHCCFMCGGFNLAVLRLNSSFVFLFSYHLSRVFAYLVLGILAGFFGSFFKLSHHASGLLFFCLGVFLLLLGIALLLRGVLLEILENTFFLRKLEFLFKKAFKFKGYKASFILGFCNGLLPCGLVYSFIAMALSSQSAVRGGEIMLVFGLSTLPAMLFLSFLSVYFSKKFMKIFAHLAYILIMLYGLYLAFLGLKTF